MVLCFACVCASVIAALIVLRLLLEKLKVSNLETKQVFITGCDSGFGYRLALKLQQNGIPVFAGCLTEKGEDALTKAASSLPGNLQTIPLDVTSQDSVDKALAFVKGKLKKKGLWGLVNNAGVVGSFGADDFLNVDDYQKVLDVNTLGVIRITQAFKPLIKKSKGRIVTTSSVFGRIPGPGNGPYSVSKFAVEAYCDALRHELAPFKVGVHILEPGLFRTRLSDPQSLSTVFDKIWERASPEIRQEYGEHYLERFRSTFKLRMTQMLSNRPDFAVDAYYHALTSRFPRRRYWVGYDSMFLFIPGSMLPTCLQDIVIQGILKIMGLPEPEVSEIMERLQQIQG